MKPRTKKEQEIWQICQSLPNLTEKQEKHIDKMYVSIILSPSFKRKGAKDSHSYAWCSRCGYEWVADDLLESKSNHTTCPNCSAKAEIIRGRKLQSNTDKWPVIELKTIKDYQLIRCFYCVRRAKNGNRSEVFTCECFRVFIDTKGKTVHYLARPVNAISIYADQYVWSQEISFKKPNERYNIYADIFPRAKVHPFFQQRGLTREVIRNLSSCIGNQNFIRLLFDSKYETIIKSGNKPLIKVLDNKYNTISRFWSSLKIAHRHGYYPEDYVAYLDYLEHLARHKKDVLNPKFICPDDLHAAEQDLIEIERRIEEKHRAELEERERRRQIALKDKKCRDNKAYRKMIKPFLGKHFEQGNISIAPLKDIKEFYDFGRALHHCVYQNEYYKKENCLILGVRVNGEMTENIEVDTLKMEIVQCRGKYNQPSPFHNQIIDLANKSLQQLRTK